MRCRGCRKAAAADTDVRETLKLDPLLPIGEGIASGWLFAFSIVIGLAPASRTSTLLLPWVAEAAVNETELKLSSGRIPPGPDGASSIHSADDSVDV
jgi:hypothetical protein